MSNPSNLSWFYAEGGSQKGPVSFADLQQKLRSGLPADALVWNETMDEWTPANQLPFFSGASQGSAADLNNPYAAPSSAPPETLVAFDTDEQPPEPPVPLSPVFCLKQGWRHFKENLGDIFLVGLVYFGIYFLVSTILGNISSSIDGTEIVNHQFGDLVIPVPQRIWGPASIIAEILSFVIITGLGLGLTRFGLNLIRGEQAEVGDLFSQVSKTLPAVGATILYFLMISFGFLLFIFPGIWLAIRFGQYQVVMVEKNLGIKDSLAYSWRLTKGNSLNLVGLHILSFLVALAGLLALFVGIFVALPVTWLGYLVAYRALHGGPHKLKTLSA